GTADDQPDQDADAADDQRRPRQCVAQPVQEILLRLLEKDVYAGIAGEEIARRLAARVYRAERHSHRQLVGGESRAHALLIRIKDNIAFGVRHQRRQRFGKLCLIADLGGQQWLYASSRTHLTVKENSAM